MINILATSVLVYSFLMGLLTYNLFSPPFAVSTIFGGVIMWANIRILAFFWSRAFAKKSIALAVFIIIFKYLILALILWSLSTIKWLIPIGFCLGLTSLLFGALVLIVKHKLHKES